VSEATDDFGEQAGQTLHTICIAVLAAGTNVRFADAVANRAGIAAGNTLDAAEIRRARRILAGANVRGYSAAKGKGYHALIHPYAMESLTADAAVMSIAQYGSGGISKQGAVNAIDGVVLEYGGFLFKESTDAPIYPIGVGGA
jgi:N4-gp56 family major capsid protein